MEKCSLKKHSENDAIILCKDCKKYMCRICLKHHSELFDNHDIKILEINENTDINSIFTGFCEEESHSDNLEYFCKNHNKLCCAACISKIKSKGNGQHTDCDVCNVDDIKEEKEKILKENIKLLEDLSNQFEKLMEELKTNFEKVTRETLKKNIEETFTQIKNAINEREKEILSKVDDIINNKNDDLFLSEKKKYEPTSKEIEKLLDKSREMGDDWNNSDKITSCINDCLIIENNVKNINSDIIKIKDCIDIKNISPGVRFYPDESGAVNHFLEKIKNFGYFYTNISFKFKECPDNISKDKLYKVTGKKENVVQKTGTDGWVGIPCRNGLGNHVEQYSWKINILETYNGTFMVGVAPMNFDINSSSYTKCGWYFYSYCSVLYSGSPHNYKNKKTNLKKPEKEIKVVLNMKSGSLKFIVDGEDKEISYYSLPTDKPLVPIVFLYHKNDSIEIIDC